MLQDDCRKALKDNHLVGSVERAEGFEARGWPANYMASRTHRLYVLSSHFF